MNARITNFKHNLYIQSLTLANTLFVWEYVTNDQIIAGVLIVISHSTSKHQLFCISILKVNVQWQQLNNEYRLIIELTFKRFIYFFFVKI